MHMYYMQIFLKKHTLHITRPNITHHRQKQDTFSPTFRHLAIASALVVDAIEAGHMTKVRLSM